MNTALIPSPYNRRLLGVSRAQFSPLRTIPPRTPAQRVFDAPPRSVSSITRDFAERSFVRRMPNPGLLDRAQPMLTHYRE